MLLMVDLKPGTRHKLTLKRNLKNKTRNKIRLSLTFALFALFSYLQLNDPDPLFWVALYMAVPISYSFHLIIGRQKAFQFISLVYILPLVYSIMDTGSFLQDSEEIREAGGVLFSFLWLNWLLQRHPKSDTVVFELCHFHRGTHPKKLVSHNPR